MAADTGEVDEAVGPLMAEGLRALAVVAGSRAFAHARFVRLCVWSAVVAC